MCICVGAAAGARCNADNESHRRIEARDRTPSPAYSMVQYKAAAELCAKAMESSEAPLIKGIETTRSPNENTLDAVIDTWFLHTYVRPAAQVSDDDRMLFHDVFRQVEQREGPQQGYMAMCTVMLASEDFALY